MEESTERPRPAAKRGRASARGTAPTDPRDEQFDLLTAALIGLAIGAGATLLLRRGPGGRRPGGAALRVAGKGARLAGAAGLEGAKWAGERGVRGARWAREHGEELWEQVPRDEIRARVREYLDGARETINEVVEDELRDLRKAVRRQRKRVGL